MVIIDRKRVPVVSSVVVSLDRDTSVSGQIDVTRLLKDHHFYMGFAQIARL